MRISRLIIGVAVILLFTVSCIEKFQPDLGNKYEEALVVDGAITNEPGPYTIRLTRSASIEYPKLVFYPGCEVSIVCDDGTTEKLIETTEGTYLTAPDGIRGEVGKKYKIRILTPDGDTYESDFEKLTAPVEIQSVYAEIAYKHDDELAHELSGYQFYVDTKPATKDTNYLMWTMESTYKFKTDFLAYYIFDNGQLSNFPKIDSLNVCWRSTKILQFFTYETSHLSQPVITHFPLNFVSTEDKQLSIRYSLKVRQLSISKKAFDFWDNIRQQNESQGSLYTSQPYQIRGNVQNVNDPGKPAFGYFQVAGVSERRIFVNRPALPFYFGHCMLSRADFEDAGHVYLTHPVFWPVYLTKEGGRMALPDQGCIDCRQKGGTINKPDFWEDK